MSINYQYIEQNYQMRKTPGNNLRPYQAFFKKRLQTQSMKDSQMDQTQMSDLTSKIIKSLKAANVQGGKLREKMVRVKTRQKTLENQEEEQRSNLKSKIQHRMRISKTNLEKMKESRKKVVSSRSEYEDNQRKKIKQMEKKNLEESLIRSTKYQAETQKFFRDSKTRRLNQYQRLQKIPKQNQYNSFYATQTQQQFKKSRSRSVSSQYGKESQISKKPIKVLKISDKQIQKKQQIKKIRQSAKQSKYLGDYINKMREIVDIRSKKSIKNKQPIKATLPKVVNRDREVLVRYNRKSVQPKQISLNSSPNYKGENRKSFSQQYQAKLEQKLTKKQYYHSVILSKGDDILLKEHQRTKKLKEQRIIKDAVNDYRRWSNFINRN